MDSFLDNVLVRASAIELLVARGIISAKEVIYATSESMLEDADAMFREYILPLHKGMDMAGAFAHIIIFVFISKCAGRDYGASIEHLEAGGVIFGKLGIATASDVQMFDGLIRTAIEHLLMGNNIEALLQSYRLIAFQSAIVPLILILYTLAFESFETRTTIPRDIDVDAYYAGNALDGVLSGLLEAAEGQLQLDVPALVGHFDGIDKSNLARMIVLEAGVIAAVNSTGILLDDHGSQAVIDSANIRRRMYDAIHRSASVN